ncbi:hypothetical protein [Paraclostridium sordellii]|uniref:hypothetical protein n=1 Tax=Paraclostridium sordellii TaxID=1505 RepID=UPI0005DA8D88|nr:hypothetical protein [Paeniclostridium sordellii]CEO26406.1 Uncharacterised protein [[Clostridium] sordellii] [Paeniclostridium sordellii]
MNDNKDIVNQLNDIQQKLDIIQNQLETIEEGKKLREKPLNFWEFLLKVEWFQIAGIILVIYFIATK